MNKKEIHIGEEFEFQRHRVLAVVEALEAGDIPECKAPDVKHVAELLDRLMLLDILKPPGYLNELFSKIPSLMALRWREQQAAKIQEEAAEMGYGDAFKKVQEAYKQPNQKGLVVAMVEMARLRTSGNDAKAIEMVAGFLKRDVDSVRRTFARQKSRKK